MDALLSWRGDGRGQHVCWLSGGEWLCAPHPAASSSFSCMRPLSTLPAPTDLQANATNPNFEKEGYKDKQAELAKLPMHAQVLVCRGSRTWSWSLPQLQFTSPPNSPLLPGQEWGR